MISKTSPKPKFRGGAFSHILRGPLALCPWDLALALWPWALALWPWALALWPWALALWPWALALGPGPGPGPVALWLLVCTPCGVALERFLH